MVKKIVTLTSYVHFIAWFEVIFIEFKTNSDFASLVRATMLSMFECSDKTGFLSWGWVQGKGAGGRVHGRHFLGSWQGNCG